MYKKLLLSALCASSMFLTAADRWVADRGQAAKLPEITMLRTEEGDGVKITAVAKGPYQSMGLYLDKVIDLPAGSKITFDLRQKVRNQKIAFATAVGVGSKQSFRNITSAPSGQWEAIEIKVADKDKNAYPAGKMEFFKIYPFRALDNVNLSFEVINFKVTFPDGKVYIPKFEAPAAAAPAPAAKPAPAASVKPAAPAPAQEYIKAEYWKAAKGQAASPPEMSIIDTPEGKAVQFKAVNNGRYQGFELHLPAPVDTTTVGALEFEINQNIRGNGGDVSIIFNYGNPRTGLIGNAKFGKGKWAKVVYPIDLRALKSLARQSSAIHGKITVIKFSMYSSFAKPGQIIAIRNLKFTPRVSDKIGKVRVINYRHLTKRTSGDKRGTVLTDGKVEEADQAFFRQYADEPDIAFDLGAVYLIKDIKVSAVAVPSQNIADITVFTSLDGAKYQTAAHIANSNASGEVQPYSIEGKALDVVGRYIRIKCGRSRTDFPVHLAEVEFTGKIPTDKEIAAAAAKRYDLGPALPQFNAENYLHFDTLNGFTADVCKTNGVLVNVKHNGQLIAERIFSGYDLVGKGNKRIARADEYTNKVLSIKQADGKLIIKSVNPAIKGVTFTAVYKGYCGQLSRELTVESTLTEPHIIFTTYSTVLPQALRTGGLYETWGSGHDMQHKFASEIVFDFPADTGPVVVFEVPKQNKTLLAYRYRCDGRYIQIGSGTVTVSGFGAKRTIFTTNGWTLGEGPSMLNAKNRRCSVESLLNVGEGSLTAAFDRYLALPEVKEFRSKIKRAEWLKNCRFSFSQGWDGLWGKNPQRSTEFYKSLIREGSFIYGCWDTDSVWGDFPVSGTVRNMFGGWMKAEELKQRMLDIRKKSPGLKYSLYTWLWSASDFSEVYKNNPDWFITENEFGKKISFFPGTFGGNYSRLISAPGSSDEIFQAITRYMDYYDQDVWYLDGGGSPCNIDWPRMFVDAPDGWDRLYGRIRRQIQKVNPERAVFFNNPENPLADMGYLESFGGVMTTNWRDGATWMYKFKLWQRPDPVFSPLYIYWLPGIDQAFRQYAMGTGLALTFGGSYDRRNDVAIMQVQQQSRWAKLVDAKQTPNWRYQPDEMLEIMPLTFGKSGWLFFKNHDKKALTREITAKLAPMGLKDAKLPVYQWLFTYKPHNLHRGISGEPEMEEVYRNHRWAGDFIVYRNFEGISKYSDVFKKNVSADPEQAKMLYLTQSPALVYSVDDLRNQLWLDNTMGVSVTGRIDGGKVNLSVSSDRRNAELISVLPDKTYAISATVNGKTVPVEMIYSYARPLALVKVGKGDSKVVINCAAAAGVKSYGKLQVADGKPGQRITPKFALNGWDGKSTLSFEISCARELCYVQNFKNPADLQAFTVPGNVTGRRYTARVYADNGQVLGEAAFRLAQGRPKVGKFRMDQVTVNKNDGGALSKPVIAAKNVKITAQYRAFQPETGLAEVDPEKASIKVGTLPLYKTHFNLNTGALEMEVKRYLKLKLSGNLYWFHINTIRQGQKGLSVRYDNPQTALGLIFDFADSTGKYTFRTLGGYGLVRENRTSKEPHLYGAARVPDMIGVLSNFGVQLKPESIFWVDLHELGAPADWSGKLMLHNIFSNVTPDRWVEVQVLESSDTLPPGVAAQKFFPQKGGKPLEVQKFVVPKRTAAIKIDGKLEPREWGKALMINKFSLAGNPSVVPPETKFFMQHDENKVYFAVEFTETRSEGFSVNPSSKPWFNDCVELYMRTFNSQESFVQYVIAGTGQTYAHWVEALGVGRTRKLLAAPEFKVNIKGQKMYIEAAIPKKVLGKASDQPLRFNVGRGRMINGGLLSYTMVPGKGYLNFTGAELTFQK